MGVLANIVPDCQPAWFGGGVTAEFTEGKTWRLPPLELRDENGDPLTLTSVSGTCTIWDATSNTSVTTMTVTVNTNNIVISKDETATVNLAGGQARRRCRWALELTDTVDEIEVWGPDNSILIIKSETSVG